MYWRRWGGKQHTGHRKQNSGQLWRNSPGICKSNFYGKKCCSTFTWFLIGKEKASARLIWTISGLRQVNQSLLQVTEEDEFDAFGRSLALGLKKLPLNLAVQCQNDLQGTLSRYRSRAICESSLSPASTCDSGATETSLHCYNFLQQSVQASANIAAQRENVGEENFDFGYWETLANNYDVQISCM